MPYPDADRNAADTFCVAAKAEIMKNLKKDASGSEPLLENMVPGFS